jgi:CelD/BcsL family acetyltransferase involved in cellulose biosynthesis
MTRSSWYVFQSFDWLATWQQTIGDAEGVSPYLIHVADCSGETLMILPLGIYREGWQRVLQFLGGVVTDYNAPLVEPDFASCTSASEMARLWARIMELLPKVDAIWLKRMPEMIDGVRNPLALLDGAKRRDEGHAVTLPITMAKYWASRTTKWAADTRRRRRRLNERFSVKFCCPPPGTPEAGAIVLELMRQKSRHWLETSCRDLFADPGYDAFYESLRKAELAEVQVHIAALKADDTTIASHWGVICRGRFYFLLTGREVGFWNSYSPGRLLIENLVEHCVVHPDVSIFDFTAGEESYKLQWCDQTLPMREYLVSNSAKGAMFVATQQIRQKMKEIHWLRNRVRRYRGRGPI